MVTGNKNFKDKIEGTWHTLSCGVEVEVVEYVDTNSVLVRDTKGNTKWTNMNSLRTGSVAIGAYRVDWYRQRFLAEGHFPLLLRCGLYVDLVEYISSVKIIIKDHFGNTKSVCSNVIRNNTISWTQFGFPACPHVKVGEVIMTDNYGEFEVLSCDLKTKRVGGRWLSSGNIQDGYNMYDVRDGRITDKAESEKNRGSWDFLKPVRGRYYVYIARLDDEVLYIGKGKHNRYLHVSGGTSHVWDLNRLFFEGKQVSTELYKDDLSNEDAKQLEQYLIGALHPKYNTAHTSVKKKSAPVDGAAFLNFVCPA